MYTQNLVLFTQEIMYGESLTSFSNFKGLLKHRKNAGLFIHCGVVAKSIQTIAISLLFLQKCRFLHKKRKGQLWGILRPPRTKLWSFFCLLWQFGLFLTTFTHQLHSGCLILANEIAANIKSTSRLKFKSTGLECSDANKTPTTCVELKGKFFPAHRNCRETESVSCFMIYALAAYQLVVLLSVTPKTACLLQTKAQSTSQTFCLKLILSLLKSFVLFGWKNSSR